eukprot:CAMPEP_0179445418 /NCGR_PEP_ID=MMETSP0799-20121207/28848_1 /TAXON_ID=46947 /ORGANISM="Geminigera cryophila, Strain CCMP2564" /LENGTH=55 /DNA_ID=CAMNT_0021233409 /DNA_START=131 /DNA_END=295 /DNA_ORIENTATION=+
MAVCCSVMQCAVQHYAMCHRINYFWSIQRRITVGERGIVVGNMLQCDAACCSVLQ